MNWLPLTDESQLQQVKEQSKLRPVVIFKYSSRCSISTMAKIRLERAQEPAGIDFYFLDILRYRAISNKVAADFHVNHESPQVLVIKNGECIYEDSHNGISMEDITEQSGGGG
jgi:bacillithiol system protein YtxJ